MNGCGSLLVAALASILASALTAGLGLAAWTGKLGPDTVFVMEVAALVAVPYVLFLGLPLFMALGERGAVSWWQIGLGGFFLAGLPLPLFSLGNYTGAWDGAMLRDVLLLVLWFGSSGLAGALAFRAAYGPEQGLLAE